MVTSIFCFAYLLLISLSDIRSMRIPNGMLMALFTSVFCTDISSAYGSIITRLLCALMFTGIFYLVAKYTKGFGAGDVKLSGVIGYCNGFYRGLIVFGTSVLFGIIFYVLYSTFRRKINVIPFAPFVCLGFVFSEIYFRSGYAIF